MSLIVAIPRMPRTLWCCSCALALVAALAAGPLMAQEQESRRNPIVIENAKAGTTDWKITRSSDDIGQQIKGYASATSVNRGRRIDFHVSVNIPQAFTIEIYRMGWYGGSGGRLMQSIGPLPGETQDEPNYAPATGMVSYRWERSYRLRVPRSWTSGIYMAKLTNADGFENYISFAVRDDGSDADFLYQQPVTTYQAYNAFPRNDAVNDDAGCKTTRARTWFPWLRLASGGGAGRNGPIGDRPDDQSPRR